MVAKNCNERTPQHCKGLEITDWEFLIAHMNNLSHYLLKNQKRKGVLWDALQNKEIYEGKRLYGDTS